MAFPAVPTESRTQIRIAGQRLVNSDTSPEERDEALDLVNRFRACHALPINTFQVTLHNKLERFSGSFMAQRLKRMPTILGKLKRFETMQLPRMQDIGGLRAVVNSVRQVYELQKEYTNSTRLRHELQVAVDYIAEPKPSGYRGLHLIYKYNNPNKPTYNGLLIELQIRTKIQHSWATAVEIMESFTKEPLKSSKGPQEWLEFFSITSSAFALLEGQPVCSEHELLTREQIFKKVKRMEAHLKVRDIMKTLPLVVTQIRAQPQASQYHLVVQDFEERKVLVRSYSRISLAEATKDYATYEAEALSGKRQEVVLVSSDKLNTAYPNLFLQSEDFVKNLNTVLAFA